MIFKNGEEPALSAETLNKLQSEILLMAHPVGSYYWSSENTNPKSLFGGTWTQIKDKFILAAGDTYSAGSTGGEATHKLTINEIPSHCHSNTTIKYNTNGASIMGSGAYKYDLTSAASTGYTGGGKEHNNMPPYETAYCWKRTA